MGNCWMVAACSCVATDKDIWRKVIDVSMFKYTKKAFLAFSRSWLPVVYRMHFILRCSNISRIYLLKPVALLYTSFRLFRITKIRSGTRNIRRSTVASSASGSGAMASGSRWWWTTTFRLATADSLLSTPSKRMSSGVLYSRKLTPSKLKMLRWRFPILSCLSSLSPHQNSIE